MAHPLLIMGLSYSSTTTIAEPPKSINNFSKQQLLDMIKQKDIEEEQNKQVLKLIPQDDIIDAKTVRKNLNEEQKKQNEERAQKTNKQRKQFVNNHVLIQFVTA